MIWRQVRPQACEIAPDRPEFLPFIGPIRQRPVLEELSPLHGAVWARQLAQDLTRRGIAAGPLLARSGLKRTILSEEVARAPFDAVAAFFEAAAEATADPLLGLRFGLTRDARDAGLLGYVGLASPDLRSAMTGIARLHRVFSDAVQIDISALGEGRFAWTFRGDPARPRRQMMEFSVANILAFMRRASGRQLAPTRVVIPGLPGAEPELAARVLGCPVDAAGGWLRIELAPSDLAAPLRSADQRLLPILQAHCREVLDRMTPVRPSHSERVARLLADGLSQGGAQLEKVAADLGMSPRSLSRRLAEEGTSFARILDRLRCDLARSWLQSGDLDVTQVAFLLGYAEPSSFAHAFRRWTGQSPSELRRRAREPAVA